MTRRDLTLVAAGALGAFTVAVAAAGVHAMAWFFVGAIQTGLVAAGVIRHLATEREAAELAAASFHRELGQAWAELADLRRELGLPASDRAPDAAAREEEACSSSRNSAA